MLQCNVPWSKGTIWRSRIPDWRHIQQTRAFTSQFCHSCPFQVVQHKHCSIVRSQVSEPEGDVHSEVSITSKMPQISGRKRCLTDLEGYLKLDMLFEPVRQLDEDDELDPPYGPDIGGGQALVDPTGNLLPKQFPPLPFDSDSESKDEAEMMTSSIACLYFTVSSFRYMAPRFKQPRSIDYIYEYFRCQSDNDFRAITRVTKEVFKCIVDLLSPDPIFYTKAKHKQAPVHWQVACALDKLGNDGQGVSAARSKLIWGLGHGTVFLYYKRVVHALCKLRGDYIQWPDMIQRLQISTRLEQKGFKDAVAFVDGTCFPLHHKPSFHGNDYLDRKKNYSINAQVVCDDRHRILHFSTGMPGSVHDSRMFYLSPLMRHPERYFSPGQYLLGDSGYAASLYLVAAYKENQRDDPNDSNECFDIERFMYELARTRVINEHTIGILKSRWSSLRGLQMNLWTNTDVFKVMHHTIACVVLHNLLLEMDPWDDESAMNEVERDGPTQDCSEDLSGPQRRAGKQKRYEVRKACFAFLDSIGETFEPQI